MWCLFIGLNPDPQPPDSHKHTSAKNSEEICETTWFSIAVTINYFLLINFCVFHHLISFFLSSLGLSVAFPQHFSPHWKVLETNLSLLRQTVPPKCTLRLGYPWTPVRTTCRCPSPEMTAATGLSIASSTRPYLRPSSASWRSSVYKTPSSGRNTKGVVGDSQTMFRFFVLFKVV